jgi:hypothetical protein
LPKYLNEFGSVVTTQVEVRGLCATCAKDQIGKPRTKGLP